VEWPQYSHLFTAEQLRELGPRGSMADNGVTDVEVTPALRVFKQAQTLLDSDRISPGAMMGFR
jgi:hypothetical protein